jgi:hypothetical protein
MLSEMSGITGFDKGGYGMELEGGNESCNGIIVIGAQKGFPKVYSNSQYYLVEQNMPQSICLEVVFYQNNPSMVRDPVLYNHIPMGMQHLKYPVQKRSNTGTTALQNVENNMPKCNSP